MANNMAYRLVELPDVWLAGEREQYHTRPYLRTAPLFIHDLADHNLWEWADFMRIPFSQGDCPAEFPSEHHLFKNDNMPNVPGTRHILMQIEGQTMVSGSPTRRVSAVCIRCLYHFILKLEAAGDPVCSSSSLGIFHDLRREGRADKEKEYIQSHRTDHYPLVSKTRYICCSNQCELKVDVEVSEPRLPYSLIKKLLDEPRILKRLERAQLENPERYVGVNTSSWATGAIECLQRYLVDVLSRNGRTGSPGPLRFSKRVKRFEVVFGPEFYGLFRFLGYREESRDGDEWFVQRLPDEVVRGVPTPLGSYRALVEDAIEELKIYELRRRLALSPHSRIEAENLAGTLGLVPAYPLLEMAFDCPSRPSEKTNGTLNYHIRFLGAMPDITSGAVEGSMNRRLKSLSFHEDALRDSMYSLARDRSGHLGHDSVFLSKARGGVGEDPGDLCNAQWDLPPSGVRRTEDEVFQHFVQKLRYSTASEIEPLLTSFAEYVNARGGGSNMGCQRLRFRVLGWQYSQPTSGSPNPMLLEVAEAVLDLNSGYNLRIVTDKIQFLQSSDVKNLTLMKATEAIHSHHPELDLGDVLAELEESVRTDVENDKVAEPMGLRNIGNTCYLNSILQYFYTINSVRNLVENYQDHKLEEKDMEHRRIGGTRSKVRELDLITGQYLTGEALPMLFKALRTAPRGPCAPSQGLANVVLLTHTDLMTLAKSGPASKEEVADVPLFPLPPPQIAPPLPARPTESNAANPAESGLPSPMSSSATLAGDAASEMSYKMTTEQETTDSKVHVAQASHSTAPDVTMTTESIAPIAEDGDGDVQMNVAKESRSTDAPTQPSTATAVAAKAKPVEATIDSESIRLALPKKHNFPMNQQDVDEIMGRIIGLMQAAIKPDANGMEGDVQMEVIMRTFFFDVTRTRTTYNEHGTIVQRSPTTESARNLMAFPGDDGPRTLYEALEQEYGRETIKEQKEGDGTTVMQHASIKNLPPILHVLIQRTKNDGRKNNNVVEIAEFLDMDRYMEAPDDSPLMAMREKTWESTRLEDKLAKILRVLDQPKLSSNIPSLESIPEGAAPDFEAEDLFGDMALATLAAMPTIGSPARAAAFLLRAFGDADESSASETGLPTVFEEPEPPSDEDMTDETEQRPLTEHDMGQLLQSLTSNIKEAMQLNKAKRSALFDGMSEQRYALHAVICHSGSGKGGHYWVWIRNFTTGKWRKYNDENITEEVRDTERLLTELNKTDHPYFVCYVRDKEKTDLVGIPKREPEKETERELEREPGTGLW